MMFIQTEATPNPNSLKFMPGVPVLPAGTADFRSPEAAMVSPLAASLFAIQGVAGVYLATDFLSVTKSEAAEWPLIKPLVLAAIMDHFVSGQSAMSGETEAAHEESDEGEVVQLIKELLDTRIRPAVAQDGGDITFQRFHDGVVYLHMKGSCAGCPSSTATLKNGIENMLKHFVPEVQVVRAAS
jgi:Fe-S cluster biogenesis protein NfuA